MTGPWLFLLLLLCYCGAIAWWKLTGRVNRGIVFLVACAIGCFAALGTLYVDGIIGDGVVELGRRRPLLLSRSESPLAFWGFVALVGSITAFFWVATAYILQTAFMRRHRPKRG